MKLRRTKNTVPFLGHLVCITLLFCNLCTNNKEIHKTTQLKSLLTDSLTLVISPFTVGCISTSELYVQLWAPVCGRVAFPSIVTI